MDFKKWLNEVTADPSYNPLARKVYRNQGSKTHLSGSRVFYVDRGKIVDGYPQAEHLSIHTMNCIQMEGLFNYITSIHQAKSLNKSLSI